MGLESAFKDNISCSPQILWQIVPQTGAIIINYLILLWAQSVFKF